MGLPIITGWSVGSLALLFTLTWLIDIPAVFARCPGGTTEGSIAFTQFDPLGLVFGLTSGLLAFLSPCGLPALPAYMNHFLGIKASKERSIGLGLFASSGFVFAIGAAAVFITVFRGIFLFETRTFTFQEAPSGFLETIIVQRDVLETMEFFAGFLALSMGILMLLGVKIPFLRPRRYKVSAKSLKSMFIFSAGWGTASIACAPQAFFPVLLYVLARGGFEPFLGYALGMSIPVLSTSLLLSIGRGDTLKRLLRRQSLINKIGALGLIAMGIYVVSYTLTIGYQVLLFYPEAASIKEAIP